MNSSETNINSRLRESLLKYKKTGAEFEQLIGIFSSSSTRRVGSGALQTFECVTKLITTITDGAIGGLIDPHQERIEILGLDESIGARSTCTFLLRRYGSDHRLLEAILLPVADAGRQVSERHSSESGNARRFPMGRWRFMAHTPRRLDAAGSEARRQTTHPGRGQGFTTRSGLRSRSARP